MTVFIHSLAVVEDDSTIGSDTRIWHFAHIRQGARIGERCVLGQNTYVAATAVIGDGVKVQNNVSIYDGVELEDEVFVGPSAVFTNIKIPRAHIQRHDEFVRTTVGRRASIGANATIVCGIHIGRYAMIGAGAVVTRSVPDYAVIVGNPGRQLGWACECGAMLNQALTCSDCGLVYEASGDTIARKE